MSRGSRTLDCHRIVTRICAKRTKSVNLQKTGTRYLTAGKGFTLILRQIARWPSRLSTPQVSAAPPSLRGVSLFLPAPSMTFPVTTDAKRNQVMHHIATELAPAFHVMDLQPFHGTALLTPPTISFEHADSYHCILFWIQFEPRSPLPSVPTSLRQV